MGFSAPGFTILGMLELTLTENTPCAPQVCKFGPPTYKILRDVVQGGEVLWSLREPWEY